MNGVKDIFTHDEENLSKNLTEHIIDGKPEQVFLLPK